MKEVVLCVLVIVIGAAVALELPGAYESDYAAFVEACKAHNLAMSLGQLSSPPGLPRLNAR